MELDDLERIFNSRVFRIPDYQRGYSWGEQQLRDLWRDIEILRKNQNHYAGVLSVISKKNSKTQADEIHVVDGQQRLTTLIILIQVICGCEQLSSEKWFSGKETTDIVKKYLHVKTGSQGENRTVIFGYEKDNPSDIYFKTKILGLVDTDSSVPEQTLYTHNLLRAKEFFAEKISKLTVEDLEVLFKKVTKNLKFNYYQLDNELNEFVAFEVMNNRGKPLSDLELLKNRMIYLSTLLPDNDDEERKHLRTVINDVWKTVYEFLGKDAENVLDDDDFLRDHWVMNFKYSREGAKVYKDFLLNERFTAESTSSGKLQLRDIKKYAVDMQKVVKHYYYMHNPSDSGCPYSEQVKFWLSKLNRLRFRAFKPLVASTLTNQVDESQILAVLRQAERFVFVASHVHFHRANKGDNRIYGLAQEFHQAPSALSEEKLRLGELGVSDVCKKLDFCKEVKKNGDNEFYSWGGLQYFLYEYELHLQEEKNGNEKVLWDNVDQETIEHIYPQNPAADCWDNFASEEAKKSLHDLGNLLLLSRKMNSKLQNRSFADKKREHYTSGSYSAIRVAENEDWTPQAIETRKKELLDFLWQRWGLKEG